MPSPCGPYSSCRDIGGSPACSCQSGYIGSPPNCRPECTINSDCSSNLACMQEKCKDPCVGACGLQAQCNVINHTPGCACPEGYTGDPFSSCYPKPPQRKLKPVRPGLALTCLFCAATQAAVVDNCNPSPCGPNANCDKGICSCVEGYMGDPYRGCRPECILSSDCARETTCVRSKCVDPCPGTCGLNAQCDVVNHIPMCSCLAGFTGNAFIQCTAVKGTITTAFRLRGALRNLFVAAIKTNPCNPSPCGPNSRCQEINDQAVCSCMIGFVGSPPSCRPECVTSSECVLNQACVNQKCVDPCPGTCGVSALCQVVNHNPICSCPLKFSGDPFVRCLIIRKPLSPFQLPLSYYQEIFSGSCVGVRKPVSAVTLRSKLPMPSCRRDALLFLLVGIYRSAPQLQTGMYQQQRVPEQSGLYQPEVQGPLSGNLRPKR